MDKAHLERWKKAVINLECASDSCDIAKVFQDASEQLRAGAISDAEYMALNMAASEKMRNVRHTGTAVFMTHNKQYYLATARHVLWDEAGAKRDYQRQIERFSGHPAEKALLESAQNRASVNIFGVIFRVRTLTEVKSGKEAAFLMNLGAGIYESNPYTFSPDSDLAIISLEETRTARFREDLLKNGYVPVDSSDISNAASAGDEVFTVGYPGISTIGTLQLPKSLQNWSSSNYCLPSFAFGRISMTDADLPAFWTDMSIYPGNSGGPVIAENRLVGIVSGNATIPSEVEGGPRTRIPFGSMIKAEQLIPLLNEQEEKIASKLLKKAR
jgi:Trypsin-like peptidase domain